jgi:hypothetical protein
MFDVSPRSAGGSPARVGDLVDGLATLGVRSSGHAGHRQSETAVHGSAHFLRAPVICGLGLNDACARSYRGRADSRILCHAEHIVAKEE